MLLRDAKNSDVAVWNNFFVVEIEQKQAIWSLNLKSLNINLLFIELLIKVIMSMCPFRFLSQVDFECSFQKTRKIANSYFLYLGCLHMMSLLWCKLQLEGRK